MGEAASPWFCIMRIIAQNIVGNGGGHADNGSADAVPRRTAGAQQDLLHRRVAIQAHDSSAGNGTG